MGFDVYGVNPKIEQEYPPRYEEILKEYGNDGWLDYSKEIPQDVKDEYYNIKSEYEENNVGYYFRNNVWWWRPLWSFVCASCDDFLTDKDMDGGSYNDGRKIAKTKAIKIGKKLCELLADGTVDKMEKDYAVTAAKASAHNKEVQAELDRITKECKDEHGDDLVPRDYPEPYKTQWNEKYATKSWDDSYPFNKDNVENFAKFCLDSGGFEIC
tara:strand:+ start:1048 stop:1683 length:636 start_codon:yes stop_codon:yes gene_type:complete